MCFGKDCSVLILFIVCSECLLVDAIGDRVRGQVDP